MNDSGGEDLNLAHESFWCRGYLELLYGLDRARKAPAGDGWTVELVEHWEQTLRRYARCWLLWERSRSTCG